jgi:hypothetical protein
MRVHGYVKVGSLLDGPEKGFAGGAPGTSSDCALENVAFKKLIFKGTTPCDGFFSKGGWSANELLTDILQLAE